MQDKNVLCYQGIQRIFRNAVVNYLRSAMHQSFPDNYEERLKKPFTDWDTIKEHATILRTTGELTAPLKDNFDILSVNHFYNLFEANYDNFNLGLNQTTQEKKQQKVALLNWLRTIKKYRDPLSHPAEVEFTFSDAFVLLDNAKRVLNFLKLNVEEVKLEKIIDELFKKDTELEVSKIPLTDQLPPKELIVSDFVGRDNELSRLWSWLEDSESGRWLLAGEGGKGKSALAYNFACKVKSKAPSELAAVIWLSAKKRKFVEGNVIDIQEPDFYDLDTALTKLLAFYGGLDEKVNSLKLKQSEVLNLLNELPALIIVDDIDTLPPENEDVNEFFSYHAAHTKSKILFTSRRVPFGMGNSTVEVSGLNVDDAGKFIISRCQLMNLDTGIFTTKLVKRIIELTEGSPLYIEDLLRLSKVMPLQQAIKEWEERGGDAARLYALKRECEMLSVNAKRVLYGACVFPGAVSFAEIEAVVGISQDSLVSALQDLQKVFLVPKPSLVEDEPKFEVNLNTKSLVKKEFGKSEHYLKIQETFKSLTEGQNNRINSGIGSIINQAIMYLRVDKHTESEDVVYKALNKNPNNSDLLGVLGFIYKSWRPMARITDAREKFKRASQLKSTNVEMYAHWCKMEISQQEWTKAIDVVELGLKMIPKNRSLTYLAGHTHYLTGRNLLSGLFNERAKKEFNEAKEFLREALKIPAESNGKETSLTLDIYEDLISIFDITKDSNSLERYLKRLESESEKYYDFKQWERLSRKYNLPEIP